MAGAPGFEPGIAGPKPAALPLGYAPLRREYRRADPSSAPVRDEAPATVPPTGDSTRRAATALCRNRHFSVPLLRLVGRRGVRRSWVRAECPTRHLVGVRTRDGHQHPPPDARFAR